MPSNIGCPTHCLLWSKVVTPGSVAQWYNMLEKWTKWKVKGTPVSFFFFSLIDFLGVFNPLTNWYIVMDLKCHQRSLKRVWTTPLRESYFLPSYQVSHFSYFYLGSYCRICIKSGRSHLHVAIVKVFFE